MDNVLNDFLVSFSILLLVHYIADFWAQTHWQATNKSKSNYALSRHVFVYSLFLLPWGLGFALLNGVLHIVTDYFTSRISSKYFQKGDYKKGFATVGLDQLIHSYCLIITLYYIGKF